MATPPTLDGQALSDLLTPLTSFATKALEKQCSARDEYEVTLADLLAQVEKERESVRELKERLGDWEERGKREGLAAQRREGEVSQAVGRVEGLEREVRELKEKCNEFSQERARLSAQLEEKKEETDLAERELTVLREKAGSLRKWKVGAEERLRDRDSEALALLRRGEEERLMSQVAGERESFLEAERLRLTKTLAELKAKVSTLEIEKSTEERSMRNALRKAKERASEAEQRADKTVMEVAELDRAVAELQADRTQAKEDHAREVDVLTSNVEIYKEAAQDAEARFKEMKILVTAIEQEQKLDQATDYGTSRPWRKRRLSDGRGGQIRERHADNMLHLLQEDLEKRAEELEQQRSEYGQVMKAYSKMKVAARAAARERDTARAEATAAESRARISEKKVIELNRRNAELERRIILTGERAERKGASPLGHQTYTGARRFSETPTRKNILQTRRAIDEASVELSGIRQREDDLIASIAAQRDLYRSVMLSSERPTSQTSPN